MVPGAVQNFTDVIIYCIEWTVEHIKGCPGSAIKLTKHSSKKGSVSWFTLSTSSDSDSGTLASHCKQNGTPALWYQVERHPALRALLCQKKTIAPLTAPPSKHMRPYQANQTLESNDFNTFFLRPIFYFQIIFFICFFIVLHYFSLSPSFSISQSTINSELIQHEIETNSLVKHDF